MGMGETCPLPTLGFAFFSGLQVAASAFAGDPVGGTCFCLGFATFWAGCTGGFLSPVPGGSPSLPAPGFSIPLVYRVSFLGGSSGPIGQGDCWSGFPPPPAVLCLPFRGLVTFAPPCSSPPPPGQLCALCPYEVDSWFFQRAEDATFLVGHYSPSFSNVALPVQSFRCVVPSYLTLLSLAVVCSFMLGP